MWLFLEFTYQDRWIDRLSPGVGGSRALLNAVLHVSDRQDISVSAFRVYFSFQ
jgi:hypothetical protein